MIQYLLTLIRPSLQRVSRGQTLTEYGLLLALIAVIVVVALLFLGPIVSRMFQNIGNTMQNTP